MEKSIEKSMEKTNKENIMVRAGWQPSQPNINRKWAESPYVLKKKFVNMTSVKKNRISKGILVLEQ